MLEPRALCRGDDWRFCVFQCPRFENAFVLDLLVDSKVVVEIKSVERLAPVL
jgi:hypothetical protein